MLALMHLYLLFSGSTGLELFGINSLSSLDTWINLVVHTDTITNIVTIRISGPTDEWFGVGFGSSTMENTYAIIASATSSVTEYKLNKSTNGIILPEMIQILNDTVGEDDDDGRTIFIQRDRVGSTNDHYTFPTIPSDIEIIWAFGESTIYSYHGNTSRGTQFCI